MFSFIQLQADTIANAASSSYRKKLLQTEISTLGFLLKEVFGLSQLNSIVLYFFMSLLNGICISVKPLR
jgi:biopolymer transport protein ExbB